MTNPFDSTILKIVKDIEDLRTKISNIASSLHTPYPVLNENTPAQLTANVDNYAPGDYAILRMSADVSRNITGISGGKKGRLLKIINVGTQTIVLAHQSASSSAANRIITSTAANISLAASDAIELYYDSTDSRWRTSGIIQ